MDKYKSAKHDSPIDDDRDDKADPAFEAELTPRQWLMQNGPILAIVFALILFAYLRGGVNELVNWAKVIVGLGLVIFVHELGHFVVAKLCDVHVTVFSIGFGPAIPGCSFKWGETTYKLAIFPLGGYVQMVGQVDLHEESDGTEEDPRSYRNKTVLQRMSIISAGVVMNAIMAVICFAIVFLAHGKMRVPAVVDQVDSGSQSFIKGLPTGAVIEQIGYVEKPYFELIAQYSALRWVGHEMPLEFKQPDAKKATEIYIIPRTSPHVGRPVIGLTFPRQLQLVEDPEIPELPGPVLPGSPAARAEPAFEFDDEIIGMSDPSDPTIITELPFDPRYPDSKKRDYFEFLRRMQLLAGQDVVIRVQRGKEGNRQYVDIKVAPAFHQTIGLTMTMGEIATIRDKSPAAKSDIVAAGEFGERVGDIITAVEVRDADGRLIRYTASPQNNLAALVGASLGSPLGILLAPEMILQREEMLDPMRLPYQLKQWAWRLEKAGVPADQWRVTLHLLRGNEKLIRNLAWDQDWQFARVAPFSPDSPEAIAELGLAYRVRPVVARVDNPADSSVQVGDRIVRMTAYFLKLDGTVEEGYPIELKPSGGWAYAFNEFQPEPRRLAQVKKVVIELERNIGGDKTTEHKVILEPVEDANWPMDDRGFLLDADYYVEKAGSFGEAVAMGFRDTHYKVMEVLLVIRGLSTGTIYFTKSIGGPLTILRYGRAFAGFDPWEFIFFLGMISINLAVINFLPIPILDGGHMVFLTYELIRGKQASERVRVAATVIGLVFILGLFLFVTVLDISKLDLPFLKPLSRLFGP